MNKHRELYPEQYSHPLCGKPVAVLDRDGNEHIRGILRRTVESRFGPLAILDGNENAYALEQVVESERQWSPSFRIGAEIRFHPNTWKVITNYEMPLDGEVGTIVVMDEYTLGVKLHKHHEDLDEWENDLIWCPEDIGCDPKGFKVSAWAQFLAESADVIVPDHIALNQVAELLRENLSDRETLRRVGQIIRLTGRETVTLEDLTREYEAWMSKEMLNLGSADEHLCDETLTREQRVWLAKFCERWDAVMGGAR